tara:strand:- start:2077 stop:2250 length:174 start_codon:yes stop_codon:yes gene_type:complete
MDDTIHKEADSINVLINDNDISVNVPVKSIIDSSKKNNSNRVKITADISSNDNYEDP